MYLTSISIKLRIHSYVTVWFAGYLHHSKSFGPEKNSGPPKYHFPLWFLYSETLDMGDKNVSIVSLLFFVLLTNFFELSTVAIYCVSFHC